MTAVLWLVAALAVVVTWARIRVDREGQAFAGWAVMLVASAATIFGAAYPVVVPSTIDPAFDVTVADASVSDYTLTVMTWVAGGRAARRARLPGLDVLGLPQAAHRRAGARERAGLAGRGGAAGALAGVPGLRGGAGPRGARRAGADRRAWCCCRPAWRTRWPGPPAWPAARRRCRCCSPRPGSDCGPRPGRRARCSRPATPAAPRTSCGAPCCTGSPRRPPRSTRPAAPARPRSSRPPGCTTSARRWPPTSRRSRRPSSSRRSCCSPSPGPTCCRPAWSR